MENFEEYNCGGCYSRDKNPTCHDMQSYKIGICPCTICIVKPICKISCEEHTKYWWGMNAATRKDV